VTCDQRLADVARVQGLVVWNPHQLAEALRSPVYVGDRFVLHLSGPGREPGQAIGYLDDGTLVVVEEARSRIGQDVPSRGNADPADTSWTPGLRAVGRAERALMTCSAVVPAAGRGQRLGGREKPLLPLAGRPALAWVLEALSASGVIAEIIVVASEANREAVESLCTALGLSLPVQVVIGGAERALSVRAGVEHVPTTDGMC
jgi:hypothetical protein